MPASGAAGASTGPDVQVLNLCTHCDADLSPPKERSASVGAWSTLALPCSHRLCSSCALHLVLRASPDHPTCPTCGKQAGTATITRTKRSKGLRRKAAEAPIALEDTRVVVASGRGKPGSLTVAFKLTSDDGAESALYRCGNFREGVVDGPRRSEPSTEDPYGDAAAEQTVVQVIPLANAHCAGRCCCCCCCCFCCCCCCCCCCRFCCCCCCCCCCCWLVGR